MQNTTETKSTFPVKKASIAAALAASLSVSMASYADKLADHVSYLPDGPDITHDDVMKAKKVWGNAVVAIGKAGKKTPNVAEEAATSAYAFELGPIQFKPTLASVEPFRPDLDGTLSYFVSGNAEYEEDSGFALKPWSKVRFDNHTVKFQGNIALPRATITLPGLTSLKPRLSTPRDM